MSKIQDHSDRQRAIGADALTDKERAVLRLADQDMSVGQIAAETGIKPHRVQHIMKLYADHGVDHWKARARDGSMLLARAINRMRQSERIAGAAR